MGVITDNLDIWSEALVGTLVLFFAGLWVGGWQ